MSFSKKGGLQWERAEVEQVYKGYRIEVSVWLNDDGWCASLFIYYSEGLRNILVTFPMNQEFKTYDDAMKAGLGAAKKWIDERMSNRGHP